MSSMFRAPIRLLVNFAHSGKIRDSMCCRRTEGVEGGPVVPPREQQGANPTLAASTNLHQPRNETTYA
jgi:hypothetical protein